MRIFILALLRTFAIAIAFTLSTFTAAAFLTFVLFLDNDASWLQEDLLATGGAFLFLVSMWFSVAYFAFFPSLLIIILFEFAKIRSALSNIICGGLVGLAVTFSLEMLEKDGQNILPYDGNQFWLTVAAAGFVGGLAYWLLAGHRAGRWLGTDLNSSPEFDR